MKKVIYKIALATFLISVFVKPASAALIIDPTQISGVLTRYVKKIQETAEKVVQLTNQVNLMATQGYSLKSLREIAEKHAKKYYKKNKGKITSKIKKVVKGTRDKKIAEKQIQADKYIESSKALYEAKAKMAKENLNKIISQANENKKVKAIKENECARLLMQYESAEAKKTGSGDITKLSACLNEVETLKNIIKDLEGQQKETEDVIKRNQQEYQKFANKEDAVAKENNERIEKLKNDQAEEKTVIENKEDAEEKEWDSEGIKESYEVSPEERKIFMENYFYNPDSLKAAENKNDNKMLLYENKMNRVLRNRKYLFVNTAVHLLQVSATTRRELPYSIKRADDMFEQTIKSEGGELGNIAAYSNVRVESTKALFLYAKLLSAKLQYLAARDLLKSELKKEFGDSGSDNLTQYDLSEEEIEKIIENANKKE